MHLKHYSNYIRLPMSFVRQLYLYYVYLQILK